jgi:D-alanyl-D-alanine carboxypeptidase
MFFKKSLKFQALIITVLLSTLAYAPVQAATAKSSSSMNFATRTALDNSLKRMVGNGALQVPGLGVVVYKNGQQVYSKFLGSRYINAHNPSITKPVTGDTRFRVASVSKHFTAYSILQLVDQGKINLDADASRYLGFTLRNPNYPQTPITVRMLLDHTSSLRDGDDYSLAPNHNIKEFFFPGGVRYEGGAHFAPKGQAPGHYFDYCNLNYGVLGTIIERVTGQRFDLYQKNHILKQLGTDADYVPANLKPNAFANLGTIYRKRANGVWNPSGPWVAQSDSFNYQPPKDMLKMGDNWYNLSGYKVGTNGAAFSPQGALRISYNELAHDLEMLINGGRYKGQQILKPATFNEMIRPQWTYNGSSKNGDTYNGTILSYGLGLYQIDGNSSAKVCRTHDIDLIGHTGEAYGLLSGIFWRPGTKDGFLYIMNGEAAPEDTPTTSGRFSGNYVWEENVMHAICEYAFFDGK